MLFRSPTILRALLALCLLVAARSGADTVPDRVKLRDCHPTQAYLGKAAALGHLEHWKADAKKRRISLKEYARTILPQKEFAKRRIPVVIDHEGRVRNTDAHHRIYALLHLAEKTGVEVEIPVQVIADYRGKSERAFAEGFVKKLGKGLFAPSAKSYGAIRKMRTLPADFAGLADSPLRSTLDRVFDRIGLSGSMFSDYFEFHLGDALVEAGVYQRLRERGAIARSATELPPERVFKKKVLEVVERMVRDPAMRGFLLEHARDPAKLEAIRAALDK